MLSPYEHGRGFAAPTRRPKPPAAPAWNLNPLDTDPGAALANAQQAKGINSLDAWLTAQQGLTREAGNVGAQRLDRAYGLQRGTLLNSLAARGALRSGDVGFQQNQLAQNFNDRRYDLNRNVLSQLVAQMSKYLQQKEALRSATTGAYQDAYLGRVKGLG